MLRRRLVLSAYRASIVLRIERAAGAVRACSRGGVGLGDEFGPGFARGDCRGRVRVRVMG